MNKIRYDRDLLEIMRLCELFSGAKCKDALRIDELVYIVVHPGEMGKAIGRQGANIQRLQAAAKKEIRIIEYAEDPVLFTKSLIYPIQAAVHAQNNRIIISPLQKKAKGLLIGRKGKGIQAIQAIMGRYFPYEIQIE